MRAVAAAVPPHQLDPAGIPPESLDYVCDGRVLRGLVFPSGQRSGPGVLVAHEAPGLNEHVQARAQALAGLGYTALALDMYGERGFPLSETMARHEALMTSPGLIHARARAALDVLAARPGVDASRLAAIGFCQGGITVLELARASAPLRCVIGFHPGLTRPVGSADGPVTARVLMMVGAEDPAIPPDHRQLFVDEMTAKRAIWELHVFGGVGHTFTNPAVDALNRDGFRYDARADRRSWQMALDLLEETCEPG